MNPATTSTRIERTPGTCGGKPRIAGTRIRVQDVAVWYENQGYSPEEIIFQYPHLNLADVHAALSYYYANREEIERDIRDAEAYADELRSKTPSKLMEKLARPNAGPLPS